MDGRFQSLISHIEQQFACFLGVTRAKGEVVLVSRVAQFQFRFSFLINYSVSLLINTNININYFKEGLYQYFVNHSKSSNINFNLSYQYSLYHPYLIIGWELRVSRMGPLRSGPKGRTDGVGQYKTPGMRDSIRAQRGRARSALFHRVIV